MAERSKSPFLESVRDLIRVKHLSYRTEEAYLGWIRRFILFHDKRHPSFVFNAKLNISQGAFRVLNPIDEAKS